MRSSKVGHRKYIRKILQIEDNWNAITSLINSDNFQNLLNIIDLELSKRFNIIESKIFFEDPDYFNTFEPLLEKKKYLEKETTYLNEEGVLEWVKLSGKTQVVPSPFHSYGKSAIIITPLFNKELHIGFVLSLSKNNRLLFNDIQIENIGKLISLFNLKLISQYYELKLSNLTNNINYYENIILNSVNYLDGQLFIESTAEKIKQSLKVVKSNINLIDKESETFYTRLTKISKEIDNIAELNLKFTEGLIDTEHKNSRVSLDEVINEILEVMQHEFSNSNLDINFVESSDKYYINASKGKFRSAIINLLAYVLNQAEQFKVLNIYYKSLSTGANVSFYLGVENYSPTVNLTLNSPSKVRIPKELEITKKLLNSVNSKLEIMYVEELGYFFNILVK
jgi:hypothetical protein